MRIRRCNYFHNLFPLFCWPSFVLVSDKDGVWVLRTCLTYTFHSWSSDTLLKKLYFKAGMPEVREEHHQDLNKKILVALIVASTLLAVVLILLACFWIYFSKKLKKKFKSKSSANSGTFLAKNICSFS